MLHLKTSTSTTPPGLKSKCSTGLRCTSGPENR
jgi:hypothetical protein